MELIFYLLPFLTAALMHDLQTDKIPNGLILSGLSAGILYTGLFHGMHSLLLLIPGGILLFFCLWPLYRFYALGAGDCKLLLMAGTFLPVRQSLAFSFLALVFAALFGIARIFLPGCRYHGTIHFSVPVVCSCVAVLLQLIPLSFL